MRRILVAALMAGRTDDGGGSAAQQAFLISFKQTSPQGEEVLRKLLRQNIRITPDTRTNTLIVMAPPDSVDTLVQLIASLDNISPVTVEIEVFQLQKADATQVVDTLEKLFGVGQGATRTGGRTGTEQEQRNLMLAQQGFGGMPGLASAVAWAAAWARRAECPGRRARVWRAAWAPADWAARVWPDWAARGSADWGRWVLREWA